MSTKGISTIIAVVLVIVCLVVGLVVGMVAEGTSRILYPIPETQELEDRVAELEDIVDEWNSTLLPILVAEAQWMANSLDATFPLTLTGEIELGALLSLTGDLATFGENEKVAAEFAVEQVNVLVEALGGEWTLKLVSEDTQTDPDLALEKVESLAARGIDLVIGPLSSGEVRAIKGYCDANKILAISQSSTAPDLAIADDYILRFCPTDKLGQGPAIGRIMYDAGKTHIIPVTRNDAWGKGLQDATEDKFVDELGGTFLPGILYDPEASTFPTEAADLNTKVSDAIAAYGADNVAVLHISFEEATALMTACMAYDVLDDVTWYGSDGTAASGALLEDTAVRDFAVIAELGREPESYSYAIYDIVWAYAYALLIVDEYDAEAIRDIIPDIVGVEGYIGASGKVTLDQYGDREAGDYDIWQITEITAGEYDWKVIGSWIMSTDSVEWV
jgi:branched-chain amino acid transport system substrate-binding protein